MMSFLTLFLGSLFLGGILSTVAGGGLSAITLSLLGTILNPVEAIAVASVLTIVVQGGKALAFRTKILWRFVLIFSVAGIPMGILGAWLLLLLPMHLIGILIGSACILSVLHLRLSPKKPIEPSTANLLLIGGASAFIAGFLGYGSGMRLAMLRRMDLTPQQMIATSALTAFCINIGRIPVYLSQLTWTADLRLLILTSIPTIILAIWIGKKLHMKVATVYLEYVIDAVIVLAGITMIVRSL